MSGFQTQRDFRSVLRMEDLIRDLQPPPQRPEPPENPLRNRVESFFSGLKTTWTDMVAQVSGVLTPQTNRNGSSFEDDQERREVLLRLATQAFQATAPEIEPVAEAGAAEPQLSGPAEARRTSHRIVCLAVGDDPNRAGNLQKAPHELAQMRGATRLFIEAASVFVGDVEGDPGVFELQKMRRFLGGKGLWDLAERDEVGRQLLPTLGAVAAGLETRKFTLKDLVATRPLNDMALFRRAVEYVRSGRWEQELSSH